MNAVTTKDKQVLGIRALTGIGIVLTLAILAPVIWSAVSAGLGLAALGAIGLTGMAVLRAIPYFGQRFENRLLEARKAEARAHPVAQRQNEILRRDAEIKAHRNAMALIRAQIDGMRDLLEEHCAADPEYDSRKLVRSIQKAEEFYTSKLALIDEAESALNAFRKVVQRNVFEDRFAVTAEQVVDRLRPDQKENELQALLSDEAGIAIQERMNKACALLDMETRSMNAAKLLPMGEGVTLDLTAIQIPETVPVGRG